MSATLRRLRQAAALALLALACVTTWVAMAQPVTRMAREGWNKHGQSVDELARLRALVSHQSELEAMLATTSAAPIWSRLYRAESASAATSMLQSDVQSVARALGVSIVSMQPIAPRTMGPVSRIGARVSLLVPMDAALNFARLLTGSSRLLVIEDASIVAPHSYEAGTNPLLNVQFAVSGILDGAE